MIVLDASTIVSAAIIRGSLPDQAVRRAFASDRVAMSEAIMSELLDVVVRPKLASFVRPDLRADLLSLINRAGVFLMPTVSVVDCRDPRDDKYLELALAARAELLISSDNDLLVLNPWRGTRILRPATYLAEAVLRS